MIAGCRGGTRRERTGMGRREEREGARSDARIVRRSKHMRRNEREEREGNGD
jgi:hypothetical protein